MFTNVIPGVVLVALLTGGPALEPPHPRAPTERATTSPEIGSLPNLVEYDPQVLVGGVPGGEAAFERLARAGVKTIVSVDGAIPDLESARRWGMRYVHLPIGYQGIDPARRVELARAVMDGRGAGVVYVHCHHGKHRCAAAAATALVGLGDLKPQEGEALMRRSGTSPHYPGLYRVVRESVVLDAAAIAAVATPQAEVERPSGIVESMIGAEEALGRLETFVGAGWRVPENHPDLQPVVDASIITDSMRLMLEVEAARPDGDPDLVLRARTSVETSLRLERLLESEGFGRDDEAKHRLFERLSESCIGCHRVHRGRYRSGTGGVDGNAVPDQLP